MYGTIGTMGSRSRSGIFLCQDDRIACGFSALLASDFAILDNFGIITLINVSLALFSTVVVKPAILVALDRFVHTKLVKRLVGESRMMDEKCG
ncbi:hypothetical protein [Numidum massiliense]|uniref:hypothetical protein n=1 Tax=Numidum massiliense TaxID=1522315 RepID=UPI0006D57E9B|nr:hypothetical protein [Numidum massiliense]